MFGFKFGGGKIKPSMLSGSQRLVFFRRMRSFSNENISLFDAISKMETLYFKRKDKRAKMMRFILLKMSGGLSFSQSLVGWIPASELMLIEAGESANALAEGFDKAIYINEQMGKIKGAVIGGSAMPAFLFIAISSFIVWFSLIVVPQLSEMLPPEKWNEGAYRLYLLSEFIKNYGAITAVLIIAFIVAVIWSVSNLCGSFRDNYLNRIPPYSLYRVYQSSSFLTAMSSLLDAGVSIDDAINRIGIRADKWSKYQINKMKIKISSGKSGGESISTPLFDQETLDDLVIFGGLGSFAEALKVISMKNMSDALMKVQAMSAVLNIVVMLLSGLAVGWIFQSIYGLTQSIKTMVS